MNHLKDAAIEVNYVLQTAIVAVDLGRPDVARATLVHAMKVLSDAEEALALEARLDVSAN